MRDKPLTDEQVEEEISVLRESENVRLARRELRLKYKRRQFLYTLRALEKRGKQLAAEGYTVDTLEELIASAEFEEAEETE